MGSAESLPVMRRIGATWTPPEFMEDQIKGFLWGVALCLIAVMWLSGAVHSDTRQATTQPTPDSIRWQHSVDARLRKLEAKQ